MAQKVVEGINDLCSTFPNLIAEWDYQKNDLLQIKPTEVSAGSGKKVWWKGKCGHSWQAQIEARTLQKQGCPYCSGRKVLKGFNDLSTTDPEYVEEWDFNKNVILPSEVSHGSNKEVWWKCKNNHSYLMKVNNHVQQKWGCPYCSNHKILIGFNDFQTKYPKLAEDWDYEKNGDLKPSDIMPTTHKKVWWICNCGHEFQTYPANRIANKGQCPICLHRTIIKGVNDLKTTDPELAKEWNYEKNNGALPDQVASGSNVRYWWKCEKGHEWFTSPASRINTKSSKFKYTRCPICSNKIIVYENSLQYRAPELAAEWDYDKNAPLMPSDVAPNSSKKIWWKGKCGHSWRAVPYSRINGKGCPYCSGNKVLIGFNDLKSQYPQLAKEWDAKKNGFGPEHITTGSNKKVWWICPYGHSYNMSVKSRTKNDAGCPICSANSTSYPEQFLYWTFKTLFQDTVNRMQVDGFEFDIAIPSRDFYIEYSGSYWHKGKEERSEEKQRLIEQKGGQYIEVIDDHKCRDRYSGETFVTLQNKIILDSNYNIRDLLVKTACYIADNFLEVSIETVDFEEIHKKAIAYSKGKIEEQSSLAITNPELAKEWDYEKNKPLKPTDVTFGSKKRIWWICDKGHSYSATPNRRTSMKVGCPYCANKKVLPGFNDLATTEPQLLKEWDFDKNTEITPQMVTRGSNKKVWWKCKNGHSYEMTIHYKSGNKVQCPYCKEENA